MYFIHGNFQDSLIFCSQAISGLDGCSHVEVRRSHMGILVTWVYWSHGYTGHMVILVTWLY